MCRVTTRRISPWILEMQCYDEDVNVEVVEMYKGKEKVQPSERVGRFCGRHFARSCPKGNSKGLKVFGTGEEQG